MKQYIGSKIVKAWPAVQVEYAGRFPEYYEVGEVVPPGGIVKDGYRVQYEDGYLSWSPKEVFEEAYRQTDAMNFGLAIEAMKKGYRVARRGWNGKNMSVAYQKGYPEGIPCNKNTAEAWGMQEGELFKCRPYLQMRCADGTFQMWLASQSDILADDWYIVD